MDYAIGTLLCATDLGPRSPEVLRHAAGLAHRFGARLHLLHVIEPLSDFARFWINATVPEEARQAHDAEVHASAHRALRQRLDAYCLEALEHHAERLITDIQIIEGPPARVILEQARRVGAELIVLGSHGHSAIGEAVLGSVAHKVTMKATAPVLLVPIGHGG
ncbi:MAG: universal stress protein [Candidatus Contendobacter sp.]|nr:universal stress protein [Candidatus Contendobacter sp.]MDG4556988.1 universal stress protein [Candidatus Contendobacter sp.]